MKRIEFEILTYLEKINAPANSRTISNGVKVSLKIVLDTLGQLIETKYITKIGDNFVIDDNGITALEPYRVKKAVIMAAGFGSRMMPATKDRPKPLVKVNGVAIVETLIKALLACEIDDITIVRGYKKEKFNDLLDKYPFLHFIDNDDYDKTNNISSAVLALDKIDNCYLCESDLYITNPDVISKYHYASNILGSPCLESDDWCYQMDKDGHIINYQKGGKNCYSYYGISYWNKQDCVKLRKDFLEIYQQEDGKDYFWEFIPLVLKKDDYKVEIKQCNQSDIMEIDNYYELSQLDSSYK